MSVDLLMNNISVKLRHDISDYKGYAMAVIFVAGDPLHTSAQTLAFAYNAAGKTEVSPLAIQLLTRYPAAFAGFNKQSRAGKIKPGTFWLWRESKPQLMFMVVRETAVGSARLRFIESVLMTLVRDYRTENLNSIAITPLGDANEWQGIKTLMEHWLNKISLPVVIYERYLPGVRAEESLLV
jgi:hypothetical protein